MKINSIKIYNFSSYAGLCEFDFRVSDNKNIILIGGQNGTGKTSLFTAIKLALYGAQCYRYQSVTTSYLNKIKKMLNHDIYGSEDLKAFVEIDIDIPVRQDNNNYVIKRQWIFNENKKLTEQLFLWENGEPMKKENYTFFENLLFNILPPNLFEFFFFDGEEIADFFATSNYNRYIKQSVLTLCSYDSLELIKKFGRNYVGSKENTKEGQKLEKEYEKLIQDQEALEAAIQDNKIKIAQAEAELLSLEEKKEELEYRFKSSGGLKQQERAEFEEKIKEQENIKSQCLSQIRGFVETMMPFAITKGLAKEVDEQLTKENEMQNYYAVIEKVRPDFLKSHLSELISKYRIDTDEEFISELYRSLEQAVRPDINMKDFKYIHDLSKEERDRVNLVLSNLNKFKEDSIVCLVRKKQYAAEESLHLNQQLRNALPEVDTEDYLKKYGELIEKEYEKQNEIDALNMAQEVNSEKSIACKKERESKLSQLKLVAKNRNAYEISQNVGKMMEALLQELLMEKIAEISKNIQHILDQLMRKDNFIDLIELDDQFNFNLYKEQTYVYDELLNLIENVGNEELAVRLGTKGVKRLKQHFEINSLRQLKHKLLLEKDKELFGEREISLYKKIEFSGLSKGEKQIFILSLYWAIIKSSKADVPFIIDTPYARIDTSHREQISKKYFPSISKQVIILSTDEEINENYYEVIKPFIGKEYKLNYIESEGRTEVLPGYFFGGKL